MIKRSVILTLLLLMQVTALVAQGRTEKKERSTFGLSILGGVNLSQIDGDNFQGYRNVGFYAGLRGITKVSERFEVYIELLYSQKGSKFESRERFGRSGDNGRHIKLDYAEVPILGAIRVTGDQSSTHVWLEAGVSIARLIDSRVMDSSEPSDTEFIFEAIEKDYDKSDFSVIAGITVDPTSFLGFGLRGTWGVKKFYENEFYMPSESRETVEFLRNYSISFYALYHF